MKDSSFNADINEAESGNIAEILKDIDQIETLASRLENRGGESGEHVRRISSITKYLLTKTPIGKDIAPGAVELITVGARLHDIGKLMIPEAILNKPGKLTPEEYEVVKTHTILGAEIIKKIPGFTSHPAFEYVYDIVRHHHERWDGRGYPDGLKGDEISVWVQAVSLSDVYDALVTRRVYKNAFGYDKAMQMIADGECGDFNPETLKQFFHVEQKLRKFYEF